MESGYSVSDVLRPLDEGSDCDFDGYIEEDDIDRESDDSGIDGNDNKNDKNDNKSEEIPIYQERAGLTVDMTNKLPIDFFHLLVTDEMLEGIVRETNLYAKQLMDAANLPPKSRANLWGNMTYDITELKKFLSLNIIMGLIHFPVIEDYWAKSWPFSTCTFSSVLKRDRFSLLLRFFHLNNGTKCIPKGQHGHDPLFKIRPFMDSLITNFQQAFMPGREMSLDESMIGFKGSIAFKQYMPKKPIKWGLKAFVLADSATGYAYNWRLYTGM